MKTKFLFLIFAFCGFITTVQAQNWQWKASQANSGDSPLPVDSYFDASGNGYFIRSAGMFHPVHLGYKRFYTLTKYDPSGNIIWEKYLEEFVEAIGEKPVYVTADSQGNMWLTLYFENGTEIDEASFSNGYYLIKADGNTGNFLSSRFLNHTTIDLEVDSNDNIIMGSRYGNTDLALLYKYNPNGTLIWQRYLNGPEIELHAFTVDHQDNIIAAWRGQTYAVFNSAFNVNLDFPGNTLLTKHSQYGSLHWFRKEDYYLKVSDLNTDPLGYIAIGGGFRQSLTLNNGHAVQKQGTSSFHDAFVGRYNSNGIALWGRNLGYQGFAFVTQNAQNDIYAGGLSGGIFRFNTYATIEWYQDYHQPPLGLSPYQFYIRNITWVASNRVFFGLQDHIAMMEEKEVIAFEDPEIPVDHEWPEMPDPLGPLTIYPNPSDGLFTLLLESLPEEIRTGQVIIYNADQRPIWEHEFSEVLEVEVDIREYGSGHYYVNVRVGEQVLRETVIVEQRR